MELLRKISFFAEPRQNLLPLSLFGMKHNERCLFMKPFPRTLVEILMKNFKAISYNEIKAKIISAPKNELSCFRHRVNFRLNFARNFFLSFIDFAWEFALFQSLSFMPSIHLFNPSISIKSMKSNGNLGNIFIILILFISKFPRRRTKEKLWVGGARKRK